MRSGLWQLRSSVVYVFLTFAAHFAACQTAEQVDRVGRFYAAKDGFSGNVVVFRDGKVIANRSYGLANIELNVPITASTRFAIGSVTKEFTAAAILLLQEQGLLHTSDALSKHYPATAVAWKDVTLEQLLQHTSGIPDAIHYLGATGFERGKDSPEDVVKSVASRPLLFPSGSRFDYNNTGYILLGLVIERVSGQSYGDFLQAHIFAPLEMNNTGLGLTDAIIPGRAYGYMPAAKNLRTADPVPFNSLFAAGGLYSTGQDIAKWLIALHSGRVLKPESYKKMTTAGIYGYAYGLRVDKESGQTDISHRGRVNGFDSETEYFPTSRAGIVILSNKQDYNDISPGTVALDTDLTHLATERDPAIRSLAGERQVAAATLGRYAGSYHEVGKKDGPPVLIEVKGGRLSFAPAGEHSSTLIAQSNTRFYMKEFDGEVEFHQDEHGTWLMDFFRLTNESLLTLEKDSDKP